MTSDVPDYPVRFDVVRSVSQSRLTNFPFGIGFLIRSILLVPHFIILYFLQLVATLIYFIATFAILFTGKYPDGMFNFFVGYMRWSANIYGYLLSLLDRYPPFSMDEQPEYPLTFQADYPASSSRLLNFPFIGLAIKYILLIPHLIILWFLFIAAVILVFVAQFAILFTGSFPEGMHGFVVGVGRWYNRITAYAFGLTDKYPPFSLK
jgi:hypothetical protein